jgi:hypothetical protein
VIRKTWVLPDTAAMKNEYDIALTGAPAFVQCRFPSVLARALAERGYNRATLTVTEEGLLLKPYRSDSPTASTPTIAELPEWGGRDG